MHASHPPLLHPVAGDQDRLGSAARVSRRRLLQWSDRYLKRFKACRGSLSADRVHAFRVTSRQLLTVLKGTTSAGLDSTAAAEVNGRAAPDEAAKVQRYLRRQLRRGLRALKDLRDSQVLQTLLDNAELRPVRPKRLRSWLKGRQDQLTAEAARQFTKKRQAKLEQSLPQVLAQLCSAEGVGALSAAYEEAMAEVRVALARVSFSRPKTLHRLRLAWKRFRYLNEILTPPEPLFSPDEMRAVQDLLGEVADLDAARRLLKEGKKECAGGETSVEGAKHKIGAARRRVLDRAREVLCGVGEIIEPPVDVGG